MIENVMHGIGGVGWFGIFSICLFFGFFTSMLFWAVRLKRTYLNSMGDLPLDTEGQRGNHVEEPATELHYERRH
jgi:hypothetical protein